MNVLLKAAENVLRKTASIYLFSSLLMLIASFFWQPALSATEEELKFVDAAGMLKKLQSQFESWSDYSCLSEQKCFRQDKVTHSASRFFYKKGPAVRIEVIGGGFRDGSIVVRSKDGKVTGKGGPWMGGIQMGLDPDSRMLILPSGINVMKADFPELILRLQTQLAGGYSSRVSAAPVNQAELQKKVLVLEMMDQSKVLKSRVFLSADELLPLRWDSFPSDKVKTITLFKDIKSNQGLKEELFKL